MTRLGGVTASERVPAVERSRSRRETSERLQSSRDATTERRLSRERRRSDVRGTVEPTSAYMGESGVIGVSRRSERVSRRGFTLVPEQQPVRDRRMEPARPSRDERAYDIAPTMVRRAVYTEDDYYEDLGISGGARRREAVVSGLRSIPSAVVGTVGSLVGGALEHLGGTLPLVVLALVALMLFAPARNLYIAHRQLDALQATYDALLVENDSIRGQLEALQTREGIEDEARARGFVSYGETKVIVDGLPEDSQADSVAETISDVEVHDERPWYVRLFDTLFGYDPEG